MDLDGLPYFDFEHTSPVSYWQDTFHLAIIDLSGFDRNMIYTLPKEDRMSNTNILDAIKVVKENERIASETYAGAAQKISNPMGKKLFEQLSEFEQYHFVQISALEKSLMDKGNFISYTGKDFPLPPMFEIKAAQELNRKSVMGIITDAIALEKQAEKTYTDLADVVTDPEGHAMFSRLSAEEHNHYRILNEAYWTLNNLGVWKWSPP
jgi:rubrerythrin